MPKISVIIPTYNRERFVVTAVASVLNQRFKDYEVIVVDDGSTDNTRSVLKQFAGRIRLLHQKNSGVSAARNAGIRSANGEWLAFLDSDDEWNSQYLATQIERIERGHAAVCMQTTNCCFIGSDSQKISYFEIQGSLPKFNGQDYLFLREPFRFIINHPPWQVGSTIIRREAMGKAGLFDTNLRISEDLDLMARVALQGPFGMIREPLVNIYRRDESTECLTGLAKDNPIEARESDERIYEKLSRMKMLGYMERKALNAKMSANRRAIGNLLLKDGHLKEAHDCYKRAFSMDHSVRSFGKYMLSLSHGLTHWRIPVSDGEVVRDRGSKLQRRR